MERISWTINGLFKGNAEKCYAECESLEQIINIINLAGFGLGIGSGRSSDYGRYHVENIE